MNENQNPAISKELTAIAKQIREYQATRALTDTALLKKFNGLGSTKTFGRICDGDLDDLDAERWLVEYRQVQTLIEALNGSETEDEPLYDDLTTCSRLRVATTDAMKERGIARLVIIQGPSGSGKTFSARALAVRFGTKIVLAEADETWKESPNNMLGGLLRAFGIKELPTSADERQVKLHELLNAKECVLVIDEAHHLGPRPLNLIKTILNKTQTVIVLSAMDTLFRRLEMNAFEEARQLTQNRLCERVTLGTLNPRDVETFIAGRLEWHTGDLKKAVTATVNAATGRGHFAFVKAAIRHARRKYGKEPLTIETWATVLSETIAKR